MSSETGSYWASVEADPHLGNVVRLGFVGDIARPALQATIYPRFGSNIGQFAVGGQDLLWLSPEALQGDAMTGTTHMSPLENRVIDLKGNSLRYTFDGEKHTLTRPEIAGVPGLSHGFMRQEAMEILGCGVDRTSAYLRTRYVLDRAAGIREGYPYPNTLQMIFRLNSGALAVKTIVTNDGETPLPLNTGFHPYFLRQGITGIRLDARFAREVDGSMVPTGTLIPLSDVITTVNGVATPVPLGLDTGITGFPDDSAAATLVYSGSNLSKLRIDTKGYPDAVVWTPHDPEVIAIEPTEAAVNAINRGTPVVVQPGKSRFTTMWWSVHPSTES